MIFAFIQNIVIIALFKIFDKNLTSSQFVSRIFLLGVSGIVLFGGIIPESFYKNLIFINMALGIFSYVFI
jgi:hypothetical protein